MIDYEIRSIRSETLVYTLEYITMATVNTLTAAKE